MGDGDRATTRAESEYTIGGSASTLVVRAWLEPGGEGALVLRGTVCILGGRMLGAFASVERLSAIVSAHLADAPFPSPDR